MRKRIAFLSSLIALAVSFRADASVLFNQTAIQQIAEETASLHAVQADDERTSLKRFHINLGHNFIGLFKSANVEPLVVGSTSAAISASEDQNLHNYFKTENTDGILTTTGATLGKPYLVAPAVFGLLLYGHHSSSRHFRTFTYALAQAYTINLGLTAALKAATRRERPDQSNDHSFPSGHAADSFMAATVISKYYGRKATFIAYTAAGFISFSRVKRDVHWMSDIVAGATLGYIVGRTAAAGTGLPSTEPHVSWMPMLNPGHRSVGLALAIRLP